MENKKSRNDKKRGNERRKRNKMISLILLARVSVPASESQQELFAATHGHKFV